MHNWFAMETEADFRRHEWERAAAAEARIAQIASSPAHRRPMHLPRISLADLQRFVAQRLVFGGPSDFRRRAASCQAVNGTSL